MCEVVSKALAQDSTIFWCGNGGSAAESSHLAVELIGRFKNNRKALPSLSLNADTSAITCIANDFGYEEIFARQLDVGLKGAFICSKVFGSEMAKQGKGVIINIASDLSIIAPDQRIYKSDNSIESQNVKPITYSVIKSGLIGMTKYLATYWSESNVRVNALSPGGVYENQNSEFVDRLTKLIPLGRMASPDEYKSAIQFLCSDASSYMTGQNLVIDGGRSVW